jgi:hypothetical protein
MVQCVFNKAKVYAMQKKKEGLEMSFYVKRGNENCIEFSNMTLNP